MSNLLDQYQVTRKVVLFLTMWLTWIVSDWAMWFAVGNARDGMEIAAIIAAVTAPVVALGGYVFKVYADSKGKM